MPTVVVFTSRSAACGRVDRRRRRGRRASACARARAAVPDRDRRSGLAQRPHRRAGGAAGAEHDRAASGDRAPDRRDHAGRVGVVGVDRAVGREAQRVRGADRARRRGRAVGERERGVLVGHASRWRRRTRRQAARGPSPRTARGAPADAGSSSRAARAPRTPRCCIAGERLWKTGQPSTPRRPGAVRAWLSDTSSASGPPPRCAPRCTRPRRPGTARSWSRTRAGRRCRAWST